MTRKTRRWCMARKARRQILAHFKGQDVDPFHDWVLPCVMAVDPGVVKFGENFGFSDGSALQRWLRWSKNHEGRWGYHWTVVAHDI